MTRYLTKETIQVLVKPRDLASHKGNHGHALIIAGRICGMGAAVIAAKSCLRSGAGLLTVCVPKEERSILQISIPEAMLVMREDIAFDLSKFSAAGVGPGMGTGKESEEILLRMLTRFNKPIVIDADALSMLSTHKKLFNKIPENTILTPHSKEFDRLFGPHQNEKEQIKTAIKRARELGVIIVLKGHHTLVTSGHESFLNTTGNAGLAKGGSGDALTGMIAAFLAQGYDPFNAAKVGVYLHGLASDIALETQSMESMLITDVIECFGRTFKQITLSTFEMCELCHDDLKLYTAF